MTQQIGDSYPKLRQVLGDEAELYAVAAQRFAADVEAAGVETSRSFKKV